MIELLKKNVPDINKNEELFNLLNLVTTYQVHSHSESCRKYNNNCRYNFGKFFSNRKIIAVPLPDGMSDDENNMILQKCETTLKCEVYINEKLDPRKVNILNQRNADYKKVLSITDMLCELGITEDEYYNALSISSNEYFQIHLKREPNACFINNYLNKD